jgi:hypothetical protein
MDLTPRHALALLVDGENLSRDLAPEVIRAAQRLGPVQVRRVYGNLAAIAGWEQFGFRLCATRPGKNAADMLLCVEAMMLALRDGFGTVAIASDDRDFTYLAEQLREIGKRVEGIASEKAPDSFRNVCSGFSLSARGPGRTGARPRARARPDPRHPAAGYQVHPHDPWPSGQIEPARQVRHTGLDRPLPAAGPSGL